MAFFHGATSRTLAVVKNKIIKTQLISVCRIPHFHFDVFCYLKGDIHFLMWAEILLKKVQPISNSVLYLQMFLKI